ncbi:hypothetical protein ACSD7O_00390 [Methylorubrum extorquens]|uniref:hypothetical protein n=1 Tax=Methylorubrum extorquens TaxID=408 RepID=UPI003F63D7B5
MARYRFIFVGAGPAALAAANVLSGQGIREVLILDAGPDSSRRGCPGLNASTCLSCAGDLCQVTNGIGGSGAGFGNKLCQLPASDSVLSLAGPDALHPLRRGVADLIGYDPGPLPVEGGRPRKGLLKHYGSQALLRGEYRALVRRLLDGLAGIEIRHSSQVLNVEEGGSGDLVVRLASGECLSADRVVLSVGRSGGALTRRVFDGLGAMYEDGYPDIGVRLEADSELFQENFFYQDDPKYKFRSDLGIARTFCACRGGSIVPVKLGRGFNADGAFLNHRTERTNLALMVRSAIPLSPDALESWQDAVNAAAGGRLLLAELDAGFVDLKRLHESIVAAVPVWPSANHERLFDALVRNIVGGDCVTMFRTHLSADARIRVFGPSIDHHWPRPHLTAGFHTSIEGLDVIGDATGLSRGVIQAIASGYGWALNVCSAIPSHGTARFRHSPSAYRVRPPSAHA